MKQQLHLLSISKPPPPVTAGCLPFRRLCVSSLASRRPPSALLSARGGGGAAAAPLRLWSSFPWRGKASPFVAVRHPFRCGMGGSDIISDMELATPGGKRESNRRVNGIYWILLLNLGIYVADHIFQLRVIKDLYLYHGWPAWYQFVTATFCHANWKHLSSNLFFLYIFGKLVEEEEGNFALWMSYIITGVGANLVSWLLLPRSSVSVGASGSVFGLFAISVLVKMSWDWRKIIEVLVLGQFVIDKVMEAAQASAGLTGALGRGHSMQTVNHIAHLSGALIGAALVLLISRIPAQPSGPDVKGLPAKDKRT